MRDAKTTLCWTCEKIFKKGQDINFSARKHVTVFQHFHAYSNVRLNEIVHGILKSIHNPFTTNTSYVSDLKAAFGSNGERYNITVESYELLKTTFIELEKWITDIQDREKNISGDAIKAVHEEKTRIYNEGIEKGRNLLMQLESGGITMDDFYKNIPYHK